MRSKYRSAKLAKYRSSYNYDYKEVNNSFSQRTNKSNQSKDISKQIKTTLSRALKEYPGLVVEIEEVENWQKGINKILEANTNIPKQNILHLFKKDETFIDKDTLKAIQKYAKQYDILVYAHNKDSFGAFIEFLHKRGLLIKSKPIKSHPANILKLIPKTN